jgi:hypothetical protein
VLEIVKHFLHLQAAHSALAGAAFRIYVAGWQPDFILRDAGSKRITTTKAT